MSRARVIAKFKPGGIVSKSAGGALELIIEAEKENPQEPQSCVSQ